MIRPPLKSTLFPYTTLFRSIIGKEYEGKEREKYCVVRLNHKEQILSVGVETDLFQTELDRKSTRLNSSHRCISYAVFCLKKKKKRYGTIDSVKLIQITKNYN